ncbi:short-chain dehydrogenase reductase [Colletotrichum incanum]|nr:short-chain dehydrogenase reductase [Colletotrichum incanum]
MTETVLVFGASGNVGVAAIIGALSSKCHVIAIVRNQASAEKIFKYVGSPGRLAWETPTLDLKISELQEIMTVNFESYISAYTTTIPYLLEKGFTGSTWTMCTGASGDMGYRVAPSVTQGALFSFAITAARENEKTNIRFNEVYLAYRVRFEVEEDSQIVAGIRIPLTTSKDFAPLYEKILGRTDIRSSRVKARTPQDVVELSYATILKELWEL